MKKFISKFIGVLAFCLGVKGSDIEKLILYRVKVKDTTNMEIDGGRESEKKIFYRNCKI